MRPTPANHSPLRPFLSALSVLSVVVWAGCVGSEAGEKSWNIPPGKFAEANFEMAEGDVASATWSATGPVTWDVHSHAGGRETKHDSGSGSSGSIEFRAPAAGAYSFLWVNGGAEQVTLSVTVGGDATLDSFYP
ncbi:MAG: hypothetical protein ACT4PT_12750 [Methanobacteriota archaeon]